jgi:hypothetical protein
MIAADKTSYIEILDQEPQYQYMFLRPRRWGKSTFLQMLATYYDKSQADMFDETFGELYIGKHPTATRSSLLVLLFDFSSFDAMGGDIERDFNDQLNATLVKFLKGNAKFLGNPDTRTLIKDDAAVSLHLVLERIQYLLRASIDFTIAGSGQRDSATALHWCG